MSSPNQTIRSLLKEGSNSNFWLAINRALKVPPDVLSLEWINKHFFKTNNTLFRLAFTSLMLLKQLLKNLPICLEGLLNCSWMHVSIKVNVFIQKNAHYIYNYVHQFMENCSKINIPFLLTFCLGYYLALWKILILVLLIKD